MSTPTTFASVRKPWMKHLLLWLLPVTCLRLLTIVHELARSSTASWRDLLLGALGVGLPQDILIAFQVLLVVWLFSRLPLAGLWLPRLLYAALFFVVHAYYLFDFLLYWKLGIRMNFSFLYFLTTAGSFLDSAPLAGLLLLLGGVLALLAASAVLFTKTNGVIRRLQLARPFVLLSAMSLVVFLSASYASPQMFPEETTYSLQNVLLYDQQSSLLQLVGGRQPLQRDAKTQLPVPTPTNERFTRVSPRYPLLKYTHQFTGPRRFRIARKPGERPHVIFYFMESFRAADIGVLGGKYPSTPAFDRLAKEGILFTNFYATGVQTTRAVISSLFGVLPRLHSYPVQSSMPDIPLIGLADLFAQRGYRTSFIHNGSLSFEKKTEFFRQHGYQQIYGQHDVTRAFPQAIRTSWGVHDEYLVPFVVNWLERQDKAQRPSFSTVFTVSNHHPWKVPKHASVPTFKTKRQGQYPDYLRSMYYSDSCLGLLVKLLRKKGLARRTILFVLADTSTPMGEHNNNYMLIKYLYEENLRIPLLILAPGRIQRPVAIRSLASQIDLLPTVMDLFQMKGLNHAIGQSLVRQPPAPRTVFFNNPFIHGHIGARHKQYKYIYTLHGRSRHLFDLQRDPRERHNLAPRFPKMVRTLHRRAIQLHRLHERLYQSRRFVDKKRVPRPKTSSPTL